jgi:uncharacterized FlaG/YvyC family protein
VKVQGLQKILGYPISVREKKEDGHSQQEKNHHKQGQNSDQPSQQESELEATPEKVDQAVEAFQTDLDAQAKGLSASVSGQGPGLKVVLKDEAGSVVRQFTGEEFLRLREAASQDHRVRGKILDQKL